MRSNNELKEDVKETEDDKKVCDCCGEHTTLIAIKGELICDYCCYLVYNTGPLKQQAKLLSS